MLDPTASTFGCSRLDEFDITFMRQPVTAKPVKLEPREVTLKAFANRLRDGSRTKET